MEHALSLNLKSASASKREIIPDDRNFARTWQEIAVHASKETNPEKLQKLAENLNRALQDRQRRIMAKGAAA